MTLRKCTECCIVGRRKINIRSYLASHIYFMHFYSFEGLQYQVGSEVAIRL